MTGQTSTLNIVVGNPAANLANLSGIAFTDTLQAGLTAPNLSTPLCGGTVAVSGNVVTLTGGNIAPNNTCTIPITVTGAAASASAYTNTISSVTSSNGGANNTPATANITVNKANTTASITGAMLTTATVVGEPYTVSAAVTVNAPGSATPTAPGGTITISDGSQTCTITLPAISCSLTSTSPGAPKNITATYNGDSNFNASPASTAALHSVNKANTTTTITADTPDSSTPGQSVTVNFTVVAVAPGSGTPTGNVTVTDSASAATCTGTVAAGTCNITLAAAGSRTLTATYVGNSSFNTSTSAGELHTVASPPTVTKSFTPTQIKVGETSVMTFSVANPNAALSLNNISFSDTFPAGIEVDNPVVATNTCGGSFSPPLAGGATSFSYSGGSRAGGASPCTISIQVKATVAGLKNNTTGAISSTETGTGATSNTATLTVVGAPTLAKAFTPATVVFGQTSSLGFTITNSNPTLALSGIVFTDTLPAGLTVATSGPTATCGGMLTTTAPNTINFTGGTLAAGNPNPTTCNFSVPVSYAQAGTFNNTSGVISATESGAGTTSNLATLTVNPATTTTTLGASVNPSVAGQSVTFTATVAAVAPGSGLPSGTVIFVIDGVSQPPVALVAGQAMLTISALSVGSHPISANYAGSTNFNSSSNVPFSQVVNKANTTLTSITDAPDPSVTGQAYTVGFTLNVTSPGAGTPTGTVTVSDGAGGTCTATLPTTSCSLTSILAGNKTVTITYNGDANFNTSSNTAGHAVNQADTLTTITADNPDPSVVGQSVTVNYTVAANSPGSGTPTGNVVITVSGGAETCTGTVAGGFCSLPLTTLGNRTITATYQGNTNYNGSASAGAPHTVSKADTTTTIVSDNPDSSAVVQNVTAVFTVVATAPGSGTPTGNVTVSDGVNSCTGTVAAGSCVLALTTPGSRTLTATYAGETNFNGSSDTESHTVVAPPSIAKAFAPNTISVNGTTTLTFTITNPAANTLTLTGVGFTDTFPNNPNLVVATPLTTTNTCGGTLTNDASGVLAANNTGIKLSGGTVGIGGSCTVSVNVTPKAQGPFNNVSGNVTSTNGGNGNTAAHTLSTNNPPTIIVSPVLRIEGAAAANATVATVNDVEDAENTLLLKVNGGTSATVNGVTVSNLAVNAAGVVTADVASPCGATTAIFTVRVTDSGGLFAEAFLPVTVTSQPPPALRINDVTLAEGSPSGTTAFTFTVALTPAHLCQAVTVNYATANGSALAGSDYTATSNSLSFAPGETVKTITVNVSKDKEVEPDETFFVNLSNPVNATLADAQGLGTITNDDFPPFTATMGDPFVCSGVGSSLLVTATLTNPNSTPQAATFNVTLPSQLTIIPNTCTANVGTCTTTPPNQVAWMGNLGAGQTVTIQYQAQVADGTPLGTLITINSTGSVNGVPTSTSASGTVSCPNNGPNSPVVNDQKPGSLLVFPYYKHDAQNKVDTRLTITNIGKLPINVHFLFLDGATCQEFDQFVCFTPNASITWKASEFDPQNKGYLIAYVTDNQGQPLAYNGLIGNAFVTDGEYVGNYGAESFASPQALGTTIGAVSTPGLSWTIPLDGIALDMAPTAFAVELQSPVDTINQKLVLAGLRGDAYAGTLGGVTQIGAGLVYNGHEALRSFSPFISGQCLVEKIIDSTTPRVAGTMASLMPKGEVGTLRFSVTAATGLLLTSNKNALSGIRTLHKVQVGISSLIVPLLTPDCQYWRPQP